jgi:hypothetical protein
MKRTLFALAAVLLILPVGFAPSSAADLGVDRSQAPHTYVKRVHRLHYAGCPDGYSCYPLYGAYGPYGGKAFWGAYTGWYH